jgi:hypothetical protein
MIRNTVSRFESPKEMQGVAERRFKGARAGRRPTRRDHQRGTKSDFEFIILCIVLTAVIFGLIHAVVYFTDSSSAVGGISAESVMASKGNNVLPVLP